MSILEQLPASLRVAVDLAAGRSVPTGVRPDWGAVLRALEHHRLTLAVADGAMPAAGLAEPRRREAMRQLALRGELAALARMLGATGIDVLFVKGPAFAAQFHSRPAHRICRDIDLLVPPAQEAAARARLRERGYVVVEQHDNGVELRRPGDGIGVELHTVLGDHPAFLRDSAADPFAAAVRVDVVGTPVPTPAPALAAVYAAYHGARHLWRRLFWVLDMAHVAGSSVRDEATTLAFRLGLERHLALGFVLARDLFGASLPAALAAEPFVVARAERQARRLCPVFGDLSIASEVQAIRSVGIPHFIALRYGLESSRAGRIAATAELFGPSPRDRAAISLPPALTFLYPAVRGLRLLGRIGRWRDPAS